MSVSVHQIKTRTGIKDMKLEEQIGNKIKNLRNQNGLTQQELADRSDLTKGFISQVERGLTAPSVATLADIIECLGSNLNDFFNEEEDPQIVFKPEDCFKKVDKTKNSTLWLVPTAQKNQMEPILVTLKPRAGLSFDKPHEGEEFGYVLEGSVKLSFGEKVYIAEQGDSFYYSATKRHKLEAAGRKEAKVLWVSTPPSF